MTDNVIGAALPRIDGPKKVSGHARYTADRHLPGMLVALPVGATIGKGRVTAIDTAAALALPGVQAVYTHRNFGRLHRLPEDSALRLDEKQPPLQDDTVRYYGQYVALVVADTFERASAAAAAVRVSYAPATPDVSQVEHPDRPAEPSTQRGDPDRAFAAAPVQVDATYTTPVETHNPIELHASVAQWEAGHLTLYETTQAIVNQRAVVATLLGVPLEAVRVVTEYLGGGFGGKLWPWQHCLLAAQAARLLGRPVKLVVSRHVMFHNVGHRAETRQRVRLGAQPDGRLLSVRHDYTWHVARGEPNEENCGEATGYLYSTQNLRVAGGPAERDVGPNTSMRGPGAVPGLFALESAMDELAVKLAIDPVQLRLANEPAHDEMENLPFSSRHLRECLHRGAERFGWARRNPAVGAMREGATILGWGMACASWMAKRRPAEVTVLLRADGGVTVQSATQDIGTGTYTVLAQMTARATGVDVNRVKVEIGDTALPPGPWSGGSMATASLIPAVEAAARAAIRQLLARAAPVLGRPAALLAFRNGTVGRTDGSGAVPFGELLRRLGHQHVAGHGASPASSADPHAKDLSIHSYGCHFVEVGWQPALARLAVRRVVTVIDAGTIVNPKTGRNQIEGAVQMGVGMALFEQTHYDRRSGAPVNANLADYILVTHADAPQVDVTFLPYPDRALNEYGARGIGEIGLAGVAPAIAAAVYHATGIRVRDLPIRIEDLLHTLQENTA
ncbi:xanthine dehydrogenase family protein molybdopterin-binding subunit [[Empedobacter] haloabium]|uniref:Xanthine dehydrogenase family protein molybdopterin-binding subunit n=1 Tax=[Empedobacter] haloabium TaxID=592317 RepID=A0ABZ1UTU9_9BURK